MSSSVQIKRAKKKDALNEEIEKLEHGKLPDPINDALKFVLKEQEKLNERLKKLESLSSKKE